MEEIRQKIKGFIQENFMFGLKEGGIRNDASFLESGMIDSTGILEIVNYLEEEFGIKVLDEEIVPDNLDSVDLISGYVHRKIGN